MATKAERKIHFVNISDPAASLSGDARRRAHSHAARETHARARRLRTVDYQSRDTTTQLALAQKRQGPGEEEEEEEEQEKDDRVTNRGTVYNPNSSSIANKLEVALAAGPSPVSLLASHRRDPFDSSAIAFKPVEHFLLDHYVSAVIPFMNANCAILGNPRITERQVIEHWVQFSLTDRGLLSTILLAACRNLMRNHFQEHVFMPLAIQYKLVCLRTINVAISKEASSVDKSTIGKVIALAMDEMMLGDLEASRNHVLGAVKMVEFNGGPESLGENEFLKLLLQVFLYSKGLFDAESRPPSSDSFLKIVDY